MSLPRTHIYDVEWQILRVGLLGSFATERGIEGIQERLQDYFDEALDDSEELVRRYRAINLLNATLLGYGSRPQFKMHRQMVHYLADSYRSAIRALEAGDTKISNAWDWSKVDEDLHKLYKDDPTTFDKILKNIEGRIKTAHYKRRLGKGGMEYRTELGLFYDLIMLTKESPK